MIKVTDEMVEAAVYACNLHSTWQKTEHDFMRIAIEAALVEYEQSDERLSARRASTCEIERREMDNEEVAKRNAELVDAIKVERASLKRKRDAAEQMLCALKSVVDIASEAHRYWNSDYNMRVGKILSALAGECPGYRKDIDEIHAAIRAAEGAER